jgi:hypothetical protein
MAPRFGRETLAAALPLIAGCALAACGHPSTQVHMRNLDNIPYVVRVIDPELTTYLALPGSGTGIAAQSSTDLRVRIEVLDAASCSVIGSLDTKSPGALVTIEAGALSFSEDLSQETTTELAATTECDVS